MKIAGLQLAMNSVVPGELCIGDGHAFLFVSTIVSGFISLEYLHSLSIQCVSSPVQDVAVHQAVRGDGPHLDNRGDLVAGGKL